MNEPYDALEAELQDLQPRAISPRLGERIGERLQAEGHVRRPVRQRRVMLAVAIPAIAAVAACAVVAIVLRRAGELPIVDQSVEWSPAVAAAFDDSLPSVWTYQRALQRSAADAELLLDKHAGTAVGRADSRDAELFVRTRGNLLLQGEL
jgi:hypothetical protein